MRRRIDVGRIFFRLYTFICSNPLRPWLVSITGLAFLAALGAYYVTAYLRFRATVYDADALYLPLLYGDIADGVSLAGWRTPTVPFIFPDMLLFLPIRWLSGNVHIALVVFGAAQILLFAGGLIVLAKQLFDSLRLEHWILILLAGSLFFATLTDLHNYVQMFAVSVYHFGILVVMPYAFALSIAFVKPCPPRSKRRWFYAAALAGLLTLVVMSDLFSIIQIIIPLIGASLLLLLLRKARLKHVLAVLGLAFGSAGAGYLLIQTIPIFRSSYKTYAGNTGYTSAQAASDFGNAVRHFALNAPFHVVLLAIFIALCATLVVFEVVRFIRFRQTAQNFIVFFAAAALIIFCLNPVSAIITTIFKTDTSFRYLLPLLILPAFWGWPYLLEFFLSPSLLRAAAILGVGLSIILIVANSLTIASQLSGVHLDDYYPDVVQCVDKYTSELGLQYGIAGYWQAKPLTALSKRNLHIVQVGRDLGPFLWITNSSWYDIQPEFIVVDTRSQDIDQPNLQGIFGPPASVYRCENLDLWIYNRPTDDLFRRQLQNSPILARLEKPGDSAEFYAAFLPGQVGKRVGLFRQVEEEPPGFLTYGPYIALAEGRYSLEIFYHIEGEENNVAHWDVNVVRPDESQVMKTKPLPRQNTEIRSSFQLTKPGKVEVRVFYEGQGKLTVERIRISKSQ